MMTLSRDVFLCHATDDKDALARPLYEALRAENLSVWFDEAEIPWGAPIAVAMQRGLSTSRYVLVLVTPEFVASGGHWRHEELNAALAAQVESGTTRILPLVVGLDHATLMAKVPFLAARLRAVLEVEEEVDQSLDWLMRRIRGAEARFQPGAVAAHARSERRVELGVQHDRALVRVLAAELPEPVQGRRCRRERQDGDADSPEGLGVC
jgi:TIR domain-containing protein